MNFVLLHGFTFVCLRYLFFFWKGPIYAGSDFDVDFAVSLSFVCNAIAFLIFHKKGLQRSKLFMNSIWRCDTRLKPMEPKILFALGGIVLTYVFLYLYVRTVRVGSLQDALFGFYTVRFNDEALWLSRFLPILSSLSIAALFLLRITIVANRDRFVSGVFWILCFLIITVQFSSGTRGYILAVPICVLLADACVATRINGKRFLSMSFVIILGITVSLVTILSIIRGQSYNSLSDLLNALSSFSSEDVHEGRKQMVGGGNISDEIKFCLNYYGQSTPFITLHTPWSMFINFIPRELWSTKPVGFGKLLAESKGFHPDNPTSLAAGLAGEGYANGGWLGIVCLSLFIGVICGAASGLAFGMFLHGGNIHLILALTLMNFSTGFVRGDMLSAWGRVYPIIFLIFFFFCMKKIKFKRYHIQRQTVIQTIKP